MQRRLYIALSITYALPVIPVIHCYPLCQICQALTGSNLSTDREC